LTISQRTVPAARSQVMFLDGDWKLAWSTRVTTGDGRLDDEAAAPRPARALGVTAARDVGTSGDEPDEAQPANAPTSTNTANLGFTAMMSGSL
jgi:hypothetical protein